MGGGSEKSIEVLWKFLIPPSMIIPGTDAHDYVEELARMCSTSHAYLGRTLWNWHPQCKERRLGRDTLCMPWYLNDSCLPQSLHPWVLHIAERPSTHFVGL